MLLCETLAMFQLLIYITSFENKYIMLHILLLSTYGREYAHLFVANRINCILQFQIFLDYFSLFCRRKYYNKLYNLLPMKISNKIRDI